MARHSEDIYSDMGSVPDRIPITGSGAGPMGVHATPADMGSAIGAGVEKVGDAAQDLAQQYGKMVNETLMTNADSALARRVGELKGAYLQNTGMAAAAAFPKYQADLEAARLEARANLPLGAQHGFDMLATRSIANHEADGSTYAAGQIKDARINGYSDVINLQNKGVFDPSVANSDYKFNETKGTVMYATQAQLDENHPGLKTDPETGTTNFDESKPEGRQLKADFQQKLDSNLSQLYLNRFDTLSKQNALSALDKFHQDKDEMPKQAQIGIESMLGPRVFNAHVQNGVNDSMAFAHQDYSNKLYNPDTSKTPLDIVQKNEGKMSDDGQSAYGIDKNAHPKEFAEISSLPESDRSAYARKFFKEEYYDKKGIAELPSNTQSIVMDGVVNHTADFGNKLIQDAKNGATPQQLIDERRAEYQRVAQIPGKEQYLQGWNNRLDNLQSGLAMEGNKKSYATNPDGSMLTQADYFRSHSEDVLQRGDAYAESIAPGDLATRRAIRESANNYMNKTISNQSAQYTMDNKNIMRGINGEFTKGKPPETETELRAIPGMSDLLDRVGAQDPKFSEGIPTMLAKSARRNDITNSPNGYATILRTLEPHGSEHPNAIASDDHLARLLGRSDGTGINMKDYNDAKPAIELPSEIKETLLKNMKDITNANGNLDGKGQERAVQWYNQVMSAYKKNEALGEKKNPNFADNIGKSEGPIYTPPTPSRMTQLENWVKEKSGLGHITMKNPDGTIGIVPAANVEKALKLGYEKVE